MMSMIFLTGMLIYEGYRLWLWSNLGPTLPVLPPPVSDLDRIDIKTDYIRAVMTVPSVTKFDTNKNLNVTLAPHIDYRTNSPTEVSAVSFVTNINNLLIQANNGTTTSGPRSDSYSSTDPLLMEPEIKLNTSRNSSKISDLLLLLRLHPNTTHKVNIFIKNKNKNTSGKPTAFNIIFNALESKLQSLTSHLGHVMNTIKPTYGEIPKSYSTLINAETTTVRDQLKEIYQLPSNITIEGNAVKKSKTTAALEIRPNTAIEDTLQNMPILNDSYKYTRDPKTSERGLIQEYLIPYTTNSELTVHEIEAKITTEIIETISKENTYSLPTPLAYNKNTKSNQETKSTLFKRVKRNHRLNNFYAINNIVRRKMRNGRLYYTKSYKVTEQKTTELPIVNTTIASSAPSNIVNESDTTSYLLRTSLEIDVDENEFSEETEVYNQFETENTTSSLKTLDIEHELNTPIDNNEEDESESVEETEKTPTKTYQNKMDAYFKDKRIEIPSNDIEITTIKDDEEETESIEVTEVSPMTHDDNNTYDNNTYDNNTCNIHTNKRKPLPAAKRFTLKKHLDGEVSYNNIRHEKNNRKTRTSKPYLDVINSTKNVMTVTNNIEDESGSAETTSVSTTIVEDPDEKPAEEMDILFILKTRLAKPTAATTSFESKDLLQILLPNSTM